ncbi:hypothetical protein MRX96_022599 [Rhipicephalus microplus]
MRYHHAVVERSYIRYWEQFLELFYPNVAVRPLGDDEIAVSDIALLRTVFTLVTKYTTRQLNRYFAWLIVQYCSPVGGLRPPGRLLRKQGEGQGAASHVLRAHG